MALLNSQHPMSSIYPTELTYYTNLVSRVLVQSIAPFAPHLTPIQSDATLMS